MNQGPKMTRHEAIKLWNSLNHEQQVQFNQMMKELRQGKLNWKEVNVDSKENVKNVVLEPKDKTSKPTAPFAKHFNQDILRSKIEICSNNIQNKNESSS
jgi:hypothetical protein